MRQLLLATRNSGKIREIKELLAGIPLELKTVDEIGIVVDVEEEGKTFVENAISKAKVIGRRNNLLTLAEDSGLEVDALGGRPGVFSARFAEGSDLDRVNKLLKELRGIPKEKRTARFKAAVAIYEPETREVQTFEGVSEGYITEKPIGSNGFGYDPIFFNFDLGKTNAQATLEEKNRVSHRGRALQKAKIFL